MPGPDRATQHTRGLHVGDALTLQQQIDNLRLVGDGDLMRKLAIGGATGMLAGLAWFWFAGHQAEQVIALFVAGVSSLIGVAAFAGGSHIRHAAAATHKGRRVAATITLHPGLDDDARKGSLHGVLHPESPHQPRWEMRFAKANGWTPPEGSLQVEAVYLSDLAWPALLVHPDGLLVPIGRPTRIR